MKMSAMQNFSKQVMLGNTTTEYKSSEIRDNGLKFGLRKK